MVNEVWKDIKEYEGFYQISNFGRVKSLKRKVNNSGCYGGIYSVKETILKAKKDKGYYRVTLIKNRIKKTIAVHRLVAEAFIDNPNNYNIVNHKDENPLNNNANNLEWCTQKYNSTYGNAIQKRKLKMSIKINQYDLKGNFIKQWDSIREAVNQFNGNTQICQCCKGKRKSSNGYIWKYAK